jgi:alpha-D-ribose 1-methylphosphonate 5-triphosphate diphosphatase PhnM
MRTSVLFAASIAILQSCSAGAQSLMLTPNQVVQQTHDGFRNAKNLQDIESIEAWCRDYVATFTFKERDQFMAKAVSLLSGNKIKEANAALKRVKDLEELDKNLGDITCKPSAMDKAVNPLLAN